MGYQCPLCRDEFTQDWFQRYEPFIYNEADSRNERQLLLTRRSQLGERWQELERANNPQNDRDEPPLLVAQPQEEIFEIDDQGNWVLQIGPDENLIPIQQNQNVDDFALWRPDTPPPEAPAEHAQMLGPSNHSSLIPDRRAAARRRQERARQERTRQNQVLRAENDDEDADDENETTSGSD